MSVCSLTEVQTIVWMKQTENETMRTGKTSSPPPTYSYARTTEISSNIVTDIVAMVICILCPWTWLCMFTSVPRSKIFIFTPTRLFDSQNNNRGGYNVGSLYYYVGSVLPIEWTNQHSCADQNADCQIIFQYMCGQLVRDGSSTKYALMIAILRHGCMNASFYNFLIALFLTTHCSAKIQTVPLT